MIYSDQLKRQIELKKTPKRIISLVPSQTELLVDLGLESSIVGVTKFCVHPKHLRMSKVVVGGTKQVNVEKIKALQPDIILCNKEENSKEIIDSIQGIAPIHLSDIYKLQDVFELIKMYGELFKVDDKATFLVNNIKKERKEFQDRIAVTKQMTVAYFIWKNPWMVAASDTFIDAMIEEAGFINAFKSKSRYPEINLNDSKLKNVDVILLSSEPFPFKESHIVELKSRFPNILIKIVDGELFSWYGSRLLNSYEYFKALQNDL